MFENDDLVYVPGVCAGHAQHPELLWVFHRHANGRLFFHKLEVDFPEPAKEIQARMQSFDVDMAAYEGCPYCESKLYFFCKKCLTLSCFSWSQVSSEHLWSCHACQRTYRMKPKTTPFQVQAQVGAGDSTQSSIGAGLATGVGFASPAQGRSSMTQTQQFRSTAHYGPKTGR